MSAESGASGPLKAVEFLADSRDTLSKFPDAARADTGFALYRVQIGKMPRRYSPRTNVGAGALAIKVDNEAGTFRTIYVAKFPEAVYVLHAFQKKSRKGDEDPKEHVEIAKRRYQELLRERRKRGLR
ncbi:MAG TPA: type II toxin-antitoxin system RelE/ParE family toxin [Rhodothermales bacterium]|nr:type II toxin-antitoxin system RelE/ParE family toxin [Rhodothermales bacterium]